MPSASLPPNRKPVCQLIGGPNILGQVGGPGRRVVTIFAVLIHGIRVHRRDHIHSGFRYRGRRAVRVEMAFAGKSAGGSGKGHLI